MGTKEYGNVLFIILIAVALFAALAYAVTSSTRGGGGDTKNESIGLMADQILQYASSVTLAVQRLKISNGCDDDNISYEQPAYPVSTVNPRSPSDKRCHLFDPAGANLFPFRLPIKMQDSDDTGVNTALFSALKGYIYLSGNQQGTDAGTAKPDVFLIIPYIEPELCKKINAKLGIPDPTTYGQAYFWPYEYLGPALIRASSSEVRPVPMVCIGKGFGSPAVFSALLIAR